jgi:hypothetical protein
MASPTPAALIAARTAWQLDWEARRLHMTGEAAHQPAGDRTWHAGGSHPERAGARKQHLCHDPSQREVRRGRSSELATSRTPRGAATPGPGRGWGWRGAEGA